MKYSPLEMCFSDDQKKFDWGLTASQYAYFRPAPPPSFYAKLESLDVGVPGQQILDLGTGVGHLARVFAKKRCNVIGVDISSNQIEYAKKLALQEELSIQFETSPVEDISFPEKFFDAAIAMQSWAYFKTDLLCSKLRKMLKPDGLVMIGNFDHLPRQDIVGRETEKLMVKYNPAWQGADFDGFVPAFPKNFEKDFILKAMFFYDEPIAFTRESWIGRIIASQAIGVSLSQKAITAFDNEMQVLLNKLVDNEFTVLHRLSAHILQFK